MPHFVFAEMRESYITSKRFQAVVGRMKKVYRTKIKCFFFFCSVSHDRLGLKKHP